MTLKASAARRRGRRSLRDEVKALKRQRPPLDPRRFKALVAGSGFNVLYALDATGQVWRYCHAYDRSTKLVSDERWVPVPMERRDK